MITLIDELKQVPDFRQAHSRYYSLWVLLLLMVMGIWAGYQGSRSLHTFVEEHRHTLCELLELEKLKVPSHSTFWRVNGA